METIVNTNKSTKSHKGLRITFILFILILVSAIVTLNFYLEPMVKLLFSQQIQAYLGDKVTIGDINLALWRGSLRVEDILIKQPTGYDEGYLLIADAISLRLYLLPLLNKELIFKNIFLVQPEINYIQLANGENNITHYLSIFKNITTPTTANSSPYPPLSLHLSEITLRRGVFSITNYQLDTPQPALKFNNIKIKITDFLYPNDQFIDSSFQISGDTVTPSPAHFDINGNGSFFGDALNFNATNQLSNIRLGEYLHLVPESKFKVKSGVADVNGQIFCHNGYITSDQQVKIDNLKLAAKSALSLKGVSANTFLRLLKDDDTLEFNFRIEGTTSQLKLELHESIGKSLMKGIGRKFGIGKKTDSDNLELFEPAELTESTAPVEPQEATDFSDATLSTETEVHTTQTDVTFLNSGTTD